MNIPNLLTVLRVALIPVFILFFYLPFSWSYWAASAVFALAAITDWFDGYLARRWEQSTPFGAFLDPVADKLMVAVALVLLVEEHANLWLSLPAVIIIGREIVVSALREWMAELGQRATVKVATIGKVKTVAQMVALACLLYAVNPRHQLQPGTDTWMGQFVFHVGDWLLAAAAVLTLWSGFQYLHAAWPALRADEQAAAGRTQKNRGVNG